MLQSDAIDLRAALIAINLNFIACRDIGWYDASLDNSPQFRDNRIQENCSLVILDMFMVPV